MTEIAVQVEVTISSLVPLQVMLETDIILLTFFQPIRSEKVSVKDAVNKVDKTVKKHDSKPRTGNSVEKPHPIQLPASFHTMVFGKVGDLTKLKQTLNNQFTGNLDYILGNNNSAAL